MHEHLMTNLNRALKKIASTYDKNTRNAHKSTLDVAHLFKGMYSMYNVLVSTWVTILIFVKNHCHTI